MGEYAERARMHLPAGDRSVPVLTFTPFETTRWHFQTQRWVVQWSGD
jgi:hypothetical protein